MISMKKIFYIALIGLSSCATTERMAIDNTIAKIEIDNGYSGEIIEIKSEIQNDLIADLNESKLCGPMKYIKSHRIFLFHANSDVDTIWTNGQIHQMKIDGKYKTYKSKVDLIKKYSR